MASQKPLMHAGQKASVVELDAANEASPWLLISGSFVARVAGVFVGSIIIEQSDDGGATVIPLTDGQGGTKVFASPERIVVDEIADGGCSYRFRATGMTSGVALCRFEK